MFEYLGAKLQGPPEDISIKRTSPLYGDYPLRMAESSPTAHKSPCLNPCIASPPRNGCSPVPMPGDQRNCLSRNPVSKGLVKQMIDAYIGIASPAQYICLVRLARYHVS